jgi:hypothetical protein
MNTRLLYVAFVAFASASFAAQLEQVAKGESNQ